LFQSFESSPDDAPQGFRSGLEASGASRSGASISESVAAPEPSTWVFIASGIALPVAGAFPRRRLAFLRQR
jgi:hypothetical protein